MSPPRKLLAARPVRLPAAIVLAGCSMIALACRPNEASAPSPATAAEAPPRTVKAEPPAWRSAAETVRRLHRCRTEGRYDELADLLVPERRTAVLALIRAVDELVAAEGRFQRSLRERLGEGSAAAFGMRVQVANILGPLSRDVEVIGETVNGDAAVVRIQVAGRVPLEEVQLERRDGAWCVVTDEPIAALPEELRNLAQATRRVIAELERRPMTPAEVERELDLRQGPVLKRIAALTAEAASPTPPATP